MKKSAQFQRQLGVNNYSDRALQKAKQQNSRTDIAMIGLVIGAVRLGLTALVLVGIFVAVAMGVGVGILEGITHPQ